MKLGISSRKEKKKTYVADTNIWCQLNEKKEKRRNPNISLQKVALHYLLGCQKKNQKEEEVNSF